MEQITKIINEDPDSLELGSATKSGKIKAYGNFNNKEAFKVKIDNAIELRKYLNEQVDKS